MPTEVRVIRKQLPKTKDSPSRSHYSDKQRYEAVVAFLSLGSCLMVSEALDIPQKSIEKWRRQPWWKQYIEQIKQSAQVKVSNKLSKIIEKAGGIVEDRLDNGELKLSKKGEIVRVPVALRTAGDILTKSIDKQVLLDKIKYEETETQTTVLDRLKAIEERLIMAAKPRKPITIEAELVEVK